MTRTGGWKDGGHSSCQGGGCGAAETHAACGEEKPLLPAHPVINYKGQRQDLKIQQRSCRSRPGKPFRGAQDGQGGGQGALPFALPSPPDLLAP